MYIVTEELPAIRYVSRLVKGAEERGHIQLVVWPTRKEGRVTGERYAMIHDNWVHEEDRGDEEHKWGQKLLQESIDTARKHKVARIYLTARDTEEREAARHIYEKHGFKRTTDGYTLEIPENQKKEEMEATE